MEQWMQTKRSIRLQQDNATLHLTPEEFEELHEENREHLQTVFAGGLVWGLVWGFVLCNQPANSPDLNMNDLEFFVSMKASH
jgi:hypothetical protein